MDENIAKIEQYLLRLQDRIGAMLATYETQVKFTEDNWTYASGGGGRTRLLEGGDVIERGGVNFSHVQGTALPASASAGREGVAGRHFQALGLSLVLHPRNPYVPTTHLNIRYFQAGGGDGRDPVWWFGGGFDLTPYYGFTEDCVHWHRVARQACTLFGEDVYPRYKKWCDDYFYLKHRAEPRGIGGLFFDDLNTWDFNQCFSFMQSVGDHFIPAYEPILKGRMHTAFGERERDFQHYRRGRYVEFNLLFDRGTIFGIQSGGRTESILMSMPPVVNWRYDYRPDPGSAEALLTEKILVPRDWLAEEAVLASIEATRASEETLP